MRDVTIATFCSSRHQDPGQGVLWKFWKCTKVKQENKGGAPSVLKCNNPADLEALNSLILKKVSSRVYWSKYHFNLNNSQVISLKSVPNVYTEQMKLNQRSLSSDVTAVDNYSEVDLQNLFAFLAALAALGLPWSLTYLLTVTFIVLDSKPSSLPDQTGNLKTEGDVEQGFSFQQLVTPPTPQVSLHCDKLGNFEELQCDKGICWCVLQQTGKKPAPPPR